MSERVVWVPHGSEVALGEHRWAELGRMEEGRWVLLDDGALIALAELAPVALMHLDRADYDHAVRGLDRDETARAVRRRVRVWSPGLLDRATTLVSAALRRALALAAQSGDRAAYTRALGHLVALSG